MDLDMEAGKPEKELEERVELSLLFDFYGALLKENQRRMFEANVLDDYNFAEIAQEEGISRQGAYDAIKRATKQLRAYEQKLGLVARFEHQKKLIQELRSELQTVSKKEQNRWERIEQLLELILEES